METFMTTLAWGFAALLGVASLVALWEHGQAKRRAKLPPPDTRKAVHLDLNLDALPAEGDQAARQAALGGALGRMGQAPSAAATAQGWTETQPMVAPSVEAEAPQG